MAGENTVSTLDGLYKEVYAKALSDVTPTSSVLTDIIEFDSDLLGDSYHAPVVLTFEHGATYNGSGGGVVALSDPKNAVLKDATQSGYEMILRAQLSYAAASRAANGGKAAFKRAWGQVLLNLRKASMKRLELTMLRGQLGLGVISAKPGSNVLTITDASWSPTTWAGMEGATIIALSDATTSATLRAGSWNGLITKVDFANKQVTVTNDDASVNGDILYLTGTRTASAFNESAGFVKIAQNTGSLFGIDAAQFSLWAGNLRGSLGTPTMGKFLDCITEAVDKGLDEKVYLLVNPKTWEVINSDLAAQRRFDGSYSKEKASNGVQAIRFYGQMGEIELRTHPFLQRGEAGFFPASCLKRVGSADVGMGVPGTDGRDVFFHLPGHNAVEARTFSDQALFCDSPASCGVITGITYS
jgi:hypothetical protein